MASANSTNNKFSHSGLGPKPLWSKLLCIGHVGGVKVLDGLRSPIMLVILGMLRRQVHTHPAPKAKIHTITASYR